MAHPPTNEGITTEPQPRPRTWVVRVATLV